MSALEKQSIGITGGFGHLGARLIRRCIVAGAKKITVLSRHASALMPHEYAGIVTAVDGNILSLPDVSHAMQGCDTVFHLAALNGKDHSPEQAMQVWETNALGTVRVLEACRTLGVKHFIYASTGHVYGAPQSLPVPETHPCNPLSVYAASKLAGELAVRNYAGCSGMAATVARITNLYGGSIGGETVIGRAVIQAVEGEKIRLKSLAEIRDFMYVDDAAEALFRLAGEMPQASAPLIVNVGSGRKTSLFDMAHTLARLASVMKSGSVSVETPENDAAPQVPVFVMDISKLQKTMGWSPSVSLEQGLALALRDKELVLA